MPAIRRLFVRLASAQLLPPGALNPAAGSDSGADFFIDHIVDDDGVIHAVWASQHDYSGSSGSDPDIWYASNDGGGWSQPAQVNGYFNTADEGPVDDREPAIAAAPDGTLYCVWSTDFNGFQYGYDYDVFVAVLDPGLPFWSDPLPINDATTDSTDDRHPAVAVTASGRPVVLWEGTSPQYPYDQEVFWSYFSSLGWTSPDDINRSDNRDWDDVAPISLAASDDGEVLIAAWSANNLFQSDIMLAEFTSPPFYFFGGPVNLDRIPQPWPEGWATSVQDNRPHAGAHRSGLLSFRAQDAQNPRRISLRSVPRASLRATTPWPASTRCVRCARSPPAAHRSPPP